jgi:dCTP deaminase
VGTLTRKQIHARLAARHHKRLVVSPLLSERQIGDASIDLRLGNQFIVFRRHTQALINPFSASRVELHRFQERRIVRFGKKFVLHPGALALAATFEYLQLPDDLEGQVEGRSSWARLGLQIASATFVEPGFSGVVTFELANVGNMPLQLYPGTRVSQLILRQTCSRSDNAYGSGRKYNYPIGPQFSRVASDYDVRTFVREL